MVRLHTVLGRVLTVPLGGGVQVHGVSMVAVGIHTGPLEARCRLWLCQP